MGQKNNLIRIMIKNKNRYDKKFQIIIIRI